MSLNAFVEAKAWGAQSPGKHLFFFFFWRSILREDQVLALTNNGIAPFVFSTTTQSTRFGLSVLQCSPENVRLNRLA